MELRRTAIVLDRELSSGQVGNVAAILMGQMGLLEPTLYDNDPPRDVDGIIHAGIRFSLVVLKASRGQILSAANSFAANPLLASLVFTELGQGLHNAYHEYKASIGSSTTSELGPVGLVVSGEDAAVRAATKKFSLLQ